MDLNKVLGPIVILIVFSLYLIKENWPETRLAKTKIDFELVKATESVGIAFTHKAFHVHDSLKNVEPWIASLGSSVAVADFDNDNFQDIYFTNSAINSANQLYKNNGDGTFRNVAQKYGVADVNKNYPSTSSLFFDCNNDGFKDLFILSHCPQLFKNEEGLRFKNITQPSNINQCHPFLTAVNVFDYNNDGLLDLIIGGYFPTDIIKNPTTKNVMPENAFDSKNYSPILFYKNNGNCQFQKADIGIQSRGYSLAIGIYDLFNSGKKNIWFATDFGMDQLYQQTDSLKLKNLSKKIETYTTSRNGMSVDFADIHNSGKNYAYVSHIHNKKERPSGNMLWKPQQSKDFTEHAKELSINRCQFSWGGKFVDLNNDSFQDLVVVNGFVTAQENKNKGKDYWFNLHTMNSGHRILTSDATYWPPMQGYDLDGNQKSCVFQNNGSGPFTDITASTDLEKDIYDGRGVAYIDYKNNGSLSLIVSNQNGPALFYENKQRNNNDWIGFNLIGTQSNTDAYGTRVTLTLDNGTELNKELQPTNGFSSQSDSRLHFGLGRNASIKHVRIIWTSGLMQTIKGTDLTMRKYITVKEDRTP